MKSNELISITILTVKFSVIKSNSEYYVKHIHFIFVCFKSFCFVSFSFVIFFFFLPRKHKQFTESHECKSILKLNIVFTELGYEIDFSNTNPREFFHYASLQPKRKSQTKQHTTAHWTIIKNVSQHSLLPTNDAYRNVRLSFIVCNDLWIIFQNKIKILHILKMRKTFNSLFKRTQPTRDGGNASTEFLSPRPNGRVVHATMTTASCDKRYFIRRCDMEGEEKTRPWKEIIFLF